MTADLAVYRAAMILADEMSLLARNSGFDHSDPEATRLVSGIALRKVAQFLYSLSEIRGQQEDLELPIAPLMLSILNFEFTRRTPKMFVGKPTGRPAQSFSEIRTKMLCVLLQELYRRAGLNRKQSSSRLSNLIARTIDPDRMAHPKPRTLESWFDKCCGNGEWHSEYEREFGSNLRRYADSLPINPQGVDGLAKQMIPAFLDAL
ncbi:MAG: hypothetical protein VXW22_08740 [Pseudomonadota bacterium]|nr:hypothetical protein [Pseudomonadota bacterium]